MRKVLIQILVSVIILVIGTFIGIAVEKYRTQMRFLDAKTITTDNTLSVSSLGEDAVILFKGKKIKNISMAMLSLFNNTDKDFADVPIYVELIPKDGTDLDVLQQRVIGSNDLPESVEEIKNVAQSKIKGAKRFGYKIKNVNRSKPGDTNDTVFAVIYYIAGDVKPEIKVATDKLGLNLRVSSW